MFLTQMFQSRTQMVTPENALPGRSEALPLSPHHYVNGADMRGPHDKSLEVIYFGMGCFWGAERLFWQLDGVRITAVGYAGGFTKNPNYEETCTGQTGHAEIVKIAFDPDVIPRNKLLKIFWEEHDPTQGMRQGNDVGSTYRSAIYTTSKEQLNAARESQKQYQSALNKHAHNAIITTEIKPLDVFYFAEDYHQQYLAKNPNGYCGLRGTGVQCILST